MRQVTQFFKKLGRISVIFLLIALTFSAHAAMAVQTRPTRYIAVVLDNSNSMVRNSGALDDSSAYLNRWAEATYALQILLSMTQDSDDVEIYTMNQNDAISDSKVQSENQFLSGIGVSTTTPSISTKNAVSTANEANADQKYVVILTDGRYTGSDGNTLAPETSVGIIKSLAKAYPEVQILYVVLDINADPQSPELKKALNADDLPDNLKTYYTTDSNVDIENQILSVTNSIYQMESFHLDSTMLESSDFFSYREDKDTAYLTIRSGIPMSRMIVVAQIDQNCLQGKLNGSNVIFSPQEFLWADEEQIARHNKQAKAFYLDTKYINDRLQEFQKACIVTTFIEPVGDQEVKLPVPADRNMYDFYIYYTFSSELALLPELVQADGNGVIIEGTTQVNTILKDAQGKQLSTESPFFENIQQKIKLKSTGFITAEEGSDEYVVRFEDNGENLVTIQCQYEAWPGQLPIVTTQVQPNLEGVSITIPPNQVLNIDDLQNSGTLQIKTSLTRERASFYLDKLELTLTADNIEAGTEDLPAAQLVGTNFTLTEEDGTATFCVQIQRSEEAPLHLGVYTVQANLGGAVSSTGTVTAELDALKLGFNIGQSATFWTAVTSTPLQVTGSVGGGSTEAVIDVSLENVVFTGQGVLTNAKIDYVNGKLRIIMPNLVAWFRLIRSSTSVATIDYQADIPREFTTQSVQGSFDYEWTVSPLLQVLVFLIPIVALLFSVAIWILLFRGRIFCGFNKAPFTWRNSSDGAAHCIEGGTLSNRGCKWSPLWLELKIYLRLDKDMENAFGNGSYIKIRGKRDHSKYGYTYKFHLVKTAVTGSWEQIPISPDRLLFPKGSIYIRYGAKEAYLECNDIRCWRNGWLIAICLLAVLILTILIFFWIFPLALCLVL